MLRSSTFFAVVAAAVLAAPLSAQAPVAGNLTFRGDVSSNGTIKSGYTTAVVGPYKADLNFGPSLNLQNAIIWCVDWEHFAPAKNTTDNYYLSSLTPGADLSKTLKGDLQTYLKAAWLFEKVDPNGGNYNQTGTRYSAKNVQGTVWEMMNGSSFGPSGNMSGNNYGLNDYTNYGDTKYFNVRNDLPNTVTNANLQYDWYVLSDYRVRYSDESRTMNQEFMVGIARPVPEPGSLALVSFGLVALGGVARRRQSQRRASLS